MRADQVTHELDRIRDRTRGFLGVSVAVHVLLLLLLVSRGVASEENAGLTEITWIDPEALEEPAALVPEVIAAEVESGKEQEVVTPAKETEQFTRVEEEATLAPTPQEERVPVDKLNERLVAMQQESTRPATAPALTVKGAITRPTRGSIATPAQPEKLERSGAGTVPAKVVPLERSGTATDSPSTPVMAAVPTRSRDERAANAQVADSGASRQIAGAQMIGPVADRPIISFRAPEYPDWAKEEGVEGTVRLYFVVLADGRVKTNILVKRTSGFEDFDGNASVALRDWKFEPLPGGATGEQWGEITFHYRLTEGS
jgi:protein TonB